MHVHVFVLAQWKAEEVVFSLIILYIYDCACIIHCKTGMNDGKTLHKNLLLRKNPINFSK